MELSNIHLPLKKYKGTTVFDCCEVEDIQTMEVRDDDIWVLSFPRSGTTLTQELVYLIHTRLDLAGARRKHMDERFPFLDLCHPKMPLFRGLKGVEEMTSPRLIKSHLHHHVLPPQLFKSKCKKIYIMRNPKDVFVSCMMLTKYMMQVDPDYSQEKFLDLWLNGETYAAPWWPHVREFWLHQSDDLLQLKYEDIVKDMRWAVRKISNHLGVQLDNDQIEDIIAHCSFDNMKANDCSSHKWVEQHRTVDTRFGGHIRKGKIGGWKDVITDEMSLKIDRMTEEKLGDLDIQFDYGDLPHPLPSRPDQAFTKQLS